MKDYNQLEDVGWQVKNVNPRSTDTTCPSGHSILRHIVCNSLFRLATKNTEVPYNWAFVKIIHL